MIRRRFYRAVDVVSAPGGYVLTLDGKPARTPGKAPMLHPKRAIAEAVAAEWRDPEDEIRSETMPLTGLTVAAIDMIGPRKPGIIEELSNFAAGDLLCHHASGPAELIAQQRKYWIPLIVWLGERFDAPLVHTVGILPITQPRESLSSLRLTAGGERVRRFSPCRTPPGHRGLRFPRSFAGLGRGTPRRGNGLVAGSDRRGIPMQKMGTRRRNGGSSRSATDLDRRRRADADALSGGDVVNRFVAGAPRTSMISAFSGRNGEFR